MYNIEWTQRALKELGKLENSIATRIIRGVDELIDNPFLKDIRRLEGEKSFRLRVGDYRVIFDLENDKITILSLGHRRNIYDK